jgi:hypothetical protein
MQAGNGMYFSFYDIGDVVVAKAMSILFIPAPGVPMLLGLQL